MTGSSKARAMAASETYILTNASNRVECATYSRWSDVSRYMNRSDIPRFHVVRVKGSHIEEMQYLRDKNGKMRKVTPC